MYVLVFILRYFGEINAKNRVSSLWSLDASYFRIWDDVLDALYSDRLLENKSGPK